MEIDITRHIGASRREVRPGQRDGQEMRTVAVSRVYGTSVEDLWEAITSPSRVARWFAPVTGDLWLGGRYQIEGNAGGEITRCEAPQYLSLTWVFQENVSWVDVTLRPEDGGARLTLEHTAPDDEYWKDFGPGAAGVGWDMGFMLLAWHIATDAPANPEAIEAWMTSDDGKAFVRQSSAGWFRADLAAGADRKEARAAAGRTVAFYTGAEAVDPADVQGSD